MVEFDAKSPPTKWAPTGDIDTFLHICKCMNVCILYVYK